MRTFKTEFVRLGLSQPRRREVTMKSGKTSEKPKERLSDREWRELMGTNRPTYSRKKGGAFRQR